MHISLDFHNGDKTEVYSPFYACILTHLRAICAFTYSSPESYARVSDGRWAADRHVARGTQNRETPPRKARGSRWELRCLDGMANPYLALVAVLHAGLDGSREGTGLVWKDCGVDPASLTVVERVELGILEMVPGGLPEVPRRWGRTKF